MRRGDLLQEGIRELDVNHRRQAETMRDDLDTRLSVVMFSLGR